MKRLKHWFIGDYLAKTDDVFERSKIELLYNYSVAFSLLAWFITSYIYLKLWLHVINEALAMSSLIAIPFVLRYSQNVKLAAWIYIIQQIIISSCSIIIEGGEQNIIRFWISLYILFSFFF